LKTGITFIALMLVIATLLTSCGRSSAGQTETAPRAAIVDQLYLLSPNQSFIEKATGLLETYGFEVDVWQGEKVTVDFYRKLAGYGYRLIILRAHGGIMQQVSQEGISVREETYLFTGETYQSSAHPLEQLSGRLQKALMTQDYPMVFAVNSGFIRNELDGRFNNTVFINMGCSSGYIDDLASAFVDKGASAYLGWNATVTLSYVDEVTLILLKKLASGEKMSEAIKQTRAETGNDPYYQSRLTLYPGEAADKNLAELTRLPKSPAS